MDLKQMITFWPCSGFYRFGCQSPHEEVHSGPQPNPHPQAHSCSDFKCCTMAAISTFLSLICSDTIIVTPGLFKKGTVKSQLTLDFQCYLAPAQRAFCANSSLASTILTNFPAAVGRYLVNRILFTARHIISIKQATFPDTTDLIDGLWQ